MVGPVIDLGQWLGATDPPQTHQPTDHEQHPGDSHDHPTDAIESFRLGILPFRKQVGRNVTGTIAKPQWVVGIVTGVGLVCA